MQVDSASILVVDDSEGQRYALARALRKAGFQTEEAVTGKRALELAQQRPDLIVLDIHLPDMTGYEVFARLRASPATAQIPVIFTSAILTKGQERIRVLQLGAEDCIARPVEPEELVAKASSLIRLYRAEAQSRSLVQALIEAIPDPIYVKDAQSRLLFLNDAALKVVGKPADQIIGHDDLEFYDDRAVGKAILENDRRVMASGITERFEEKLLTPEGYRDYLDTKAPWRDSEGRTIGIIGVSRDITERKRAEEALRANEERLRYASELVGLLPYTWEPQTGALHWEAAIKALWGLPPEAIPNHQVFLGAVHPDDRAYVEQRVAHSLDPTGDGLYEAEYRVNAPDGVPRWISARGRTTFSDGQPIIHRGVMLDITDRKRMEAALRESEHNLTAELEAAQRLHQVSTQLIQADNIEALYDHILDTAIAVLHSDFGSMQMLYPERGEKGELRLLSHRGFTPQAASFWEWVRTGSQSTCGVALRTGQRILVSDIEKCDFMVGSDDLAAYLETGIRAVQTTPLISRSGALIGMISTHWRQPHQPTENELLALDMLARQAADLIDRKRSEEALRDSESRYRTLFGSVDEGFCVIEMLFDETGKPNDWRYLEVNPAFERHNGLHEATGKTIREMVPNIETRWFEIYGRVALTGAPTRFVEFSQALNRWFDLYAFRVGEPEQRRVAVLFANITEQVQAQEALRKSKERLDLALEVAELGEWDLDLTEHTASRSLRHDQIFGYESLLPKWTYEIFLEHVIPEDRAEVDKKFKTAVATGVWDLETRIRRRDGEVRWIWARGRLRRDEKGQPTHMFGTVMDITEHKRTLELLIRSEKVAALGRMAATLAHDINNPLAAAVNSLFLVRNSEGLSDSMKHFLDLADAELRRISHITRQALGFYREDTKPTKVSVESILEEAVALFRSKINAKHVKIERRFTNELEVIGVAGELRQVFCNLLANSLDAVPEKGAIQLRVSTARTANGGTRPVRVTIGDNGTGINRNFMPRLFEPLFTTKGNTGTGLGLWVSRQLIQKHGGSVQVRSSTSGLHRGTTFSITLPGAPAARANVASAPEN